MHEGEVRDILEDWEGSRGADQTQTTCLQALQEGITPLAVTPSIKRKRNEASSNKLTTQPKLVPIPQRHPLRLVYGSFPTSHPVMPKQVNFIDVSPGTRFISWGVGSRRHKWHENPSNPPRHSRRHHLFVVGVYTLRDRTRCHLQLPTYGVMPLVPVPGIGTEGGANA